MTADEFENGYAERSKKTVSELRALGRIVWPCACGEQECEGWQSISAENARDLYVNLKNGRDTSFEPGLSSTRTILWIPRSDHGR